VFLEHAVGVALVKVDGEVEALGRRGDEVLLLEEDVGQGHVEPVQLLVHLIIISHARIKLSLSENATDCWCNYVIFIQLNPGSIWMNLITIVNRSIY
jgi:hypothetical protein